MTDVKPTIESVPGFKVAGVHAGLKAEGALDFALIYSETPCVAAGVFTTNQVKAAPVLVDQERLQKNPTSIRAVAINTKCANACTGQQGIDNALQTARWVAEWLGCSEDEVLVMSTGVIGTQLPMDKIRRGVDLAVDALGDNNWEAAARAIMTTDTRPKMASFCSRHGYQIAGIAKGSGMIAPNMATMLSVVVTDASFNEVQAVSDVLKGSIGRSFNCIAVDGDTSTNDTVLLLANGHSAKFSNNHAFEEELDALTIDLAKEVVRDGEGATKFITVAVRGVGSRENAKQVANTIATSPLVKTAFYGGDANWGRIVAAAGRSGVTVDPLTMHLWITPGEQPKEDLLLFENGMPTDYSEAEATEIMNQPSISVLLDCGQGGLDAIVWTCDLSHDYVSINGHYRT
ncbi:MAG TPA: bifunctional glutamate N-acetyltransferase/amino-acid acetyltransferase ArgJ [Oceanobacillus sp.]|nr:bifunctional glutamate N-acetyltransferase/amino-acid acetyltransferase ArgJ [Oceanobacillus sp.]